MCCRRDREQSLIAGYRAPRDTLHRPQGAQSVMWIVRVALNRPYTFVVLALTILLVGPIAILRTPTDIFPKINIPVVGVIWSYGGLGSEELSNRIVSVFERSVTTTVNDIEHIESQTLRGISIVKIFFQPNVKIEMAIAQVTAISQSALRQMPPGTNPPFAVSYTHLRAHETR